MTKEKAIDLLDNLIGMVTDNQDSDYDEALKMAIDALKERPKGKWVGILEYCKHLEEETGERYVPTGLGKLAYCNQCWHANDRHSNFCPNCGADMRGSDDEESM